MVSPARSLLTLVWCETGMPRFRLRGRPNMTPFSLFVVCSALINPSRLLALVLHPSPPGGRIAPTGAFGTPRRFEVRIERCLVCDPVTSQDIFF